MFSFQVLIDSLWCACSSNFIQVCPSLSAACAVRARANAIASTGVAARLLFMATSLPYSTLFDAGCACMGAISHMRPRIDANVCCVCGRAVGFQCAFQSVSGQTKRNTQFCVSHLPIENGLCKSADPSTVRDALFIIISTFSTIFICFGFTNSHPDFFKIKQFLVIEIL